LKSLPSCPMITPFNDTLFRSMPIVGILRFFPRDQVEHLVPAVVDGGLVNLEVTLNSPGAADLIRLTRDLLGPRGNVGAGTVTSMQGLDLALEAGASFIVTPVVLPEVIRACVERGVPVMPGAMTPTEIFTAWNLGASLVKVFPADQLGPGHLRAVKAPFPEIRLMPTGGVTVETLPAFRDAGADAFGVGSPLFDPRQVAAGNWDWFRQRASRFCESFGSPKA
ncbi:MAG: bifunctional 4-hydroxy-2-oxoglutarate aldolase/2-dehydro-3-deoxy-phosphogluconate aldolase, partial [Proteobacteria bacterium]|nr:bifunctional 4-hydroxy-2-oxoglutarate aldolase/2-dehydro-3-deoxy-phosphogluconate aldolase [Pseudomonadota bacterium]